MNSAELNSSRSNSTSKAPQLIVALDFPNLKSTLDLAEQLDPTLCRVKVGKELFTQVGPEVIRRLHDLGHEIFLDLKFHDIPNTVANACAAAADLGVWMINVHASGGGQMMSAAKEKLANRSSAPLLIAVTVLTSSSQKELNEIGITATPEEQVIRLASLTSECGLDGVVCSAQEAKALRALTRPEFNLVTPGIRPAGFDAGDQKRVCTPAEAINNGADYIVIGRPITQAPDPVAVLKEVVSGLPK